jgi:hypothetical protein
MRKNIKPVVIPEFTHEGALAARMTPEQALRRSVMSCMLWENEFYEDGETIAERIGKLVKVVSPAKVAAIAIEARTKMNLRHVPLLIMAHLAGVTSGTSLVSETLPKVINRADELAEFLAIYAQVNGVSPRDLKPKMSNQVRKGLAAAFLRFNEYSLAKYNREGAITLKDVLFLVHPKPQDEAQKALWERLMADKLAVPDTWEVELSRGADKQATWTRLIREDKLGYMALLKNLRNMEKAGVDHKLVSDAIVARRNGADKVLPFRFVAAARAAMSFEPALDEALLAAIDDLPHLDGNTVILVDVSGSMDAKLSAKSDLTRKDAAAALASMIPGQRQVFSFANHVMQIPPRMGMAGIDAIQKSQSGGTYLFDAIVEINSKVIYDRIIVITDEQTAGIASSDVQGKRKSCPAPQPGAKGYMINVASAKSGVGYGPWVHLDGFSEHVLRWIVEHEKAEVPTPSKKPAPGMAA